MFGNRSSVRKGGLPFVQRIDILFGNRSRVRVYPHHNDVRVWRVWEAGACLAKYLIQHPDAVRGRSVMEDSVGPPGSVSSSFPFTKFFDAVAPYYPVTFSPPLNNPYGITSNGIQSSLMAVLCHNDHNQNNGLCSGNTAPSSSS